MGFDILTGDALETMKTMPSEYVHCAVTSPPYWGLRDYGTGQWTGGKIDCDHKNLAYARNQETPGGRGGSMPMSETIYKEKCGKCGARRKDMQLGLEKTPEEYTENLVEVFCELRRVLRADGTLWLNLGDCYASQRSGDNGNPEHHTTLGGGRPASMKWDSSSSGLKPKDLVGIPWRVAFALQSDGWWLRSDIVWAKPNPMPESVTDRPTRAHEYIFLLSKSARYHYDHEAIQEPVAEDSIPRLGRGRKTGWAPPGQKAHAGVVAARPNTNSQPDSFKGSSFTKGKTAALKPNVGQGERNDSDTRNKRTVWWIATQPFPETHFATFPPKLIEPCILAGCPRGGTVLDPFAGAGTTGLVADRLGRDFIGVELNPEYVDMANARIRNDAPLFNTKGGDM